MKKREAIKILKGIKDDKLKEQESLRLKRKEALKKLASLRGKVECVGDLDKMRRGV